MRRLPGVAPINRRRSDLGLWSNDKGDAQYPFALGLALLGSADRRHRYPRAALMC